MEANNNFLIFTIGRMNPPTPGHLGLIKKLIEKALDMDTDKVFIILSKSIDEKNPLACENPTNAELSYKKQLIDPMVTVLKEQMKHDIIETSKIEKIDNIRVVTICVPDIKGATPFTPLYSIIYGKEEPYHFFTDTSSLDVFMIIGDDRADLLDSVKKQLVGKEKINSVNGYVLPRDNMSTFSEMSCDQLSELDISTVPTSAFSASFVRNIVKCQLKDSFDDIYRPYFQQDIIDKLYISIQNGLQPQINTGKKRKRGGKNKSRQKSRKILHKRSKKNKRRVTKRIQ
jgi:hypothetical protein